MGRNLRHLGAAGILVASVLSVAIAAAPARQKAAPGVTVTIDYNSPATATKEFKFRRVPSPAKDDAAAKATVRIVDGEMDENGATPSALVDGLLPSDEDQPGSNFFFNAGTSGGSIRMYLGSLVDIAQINSYSWHPNTRGPQVYTVYASTGDDPTFDSTPKGAADPTAVGWTWIANVDTRVGSANDGGQYGVSITKTGGSLGSYRYLLFVCASTESDDEWGNTFYSEIDVVAKKTAGSK